MQHFMKQKMKHIQPLSWDTEWAYQLFLPQETRHFKRSKKSFISRSGIVYGCYAKSCFHLIQWKRQNSNNVMIEKIAIMARKCLYTQAF